MLSYTFFRSDDDELEEEEGGGGGVGGGGGEGKATGVRTHGTGAVPPGSRDTPRWVRRLPRVVIKSAICDGVNRANHFKSPAPRRARSPRIPDDGEGKKKEANPNMPRKKRADELAAAEAKEAEEEARLREASSDVPMADLVASFADELRCQLCSEIFETQYCVRPQLLPRVCRGEAARERGVQERVPAREVHAAVLREGPRAQPHDREHGDAQGRRRALRRGI